MATDGVENPNQFDEPEQRQVMSPNATTTQGNDPGQRPSMNGVQGPLRGSQDIDGEVLAGASDRERFPPASAQPQSGGTPGVTSVRQTGAGAGLSGPTMTSGGNVADDVQPRPSMLPGPDRTGGFYNYGCT